jgi:hypothetical protein
MYSLFLFLICSRGQPHLYIIAVGEEGKEGEEEEEQGLNWAMLNIVFSQHFSSFTLFILIISLIFLPLCNV